MRIGNSSPYHDTYELNPPILMVHPSIQTRGCRHLITLLLLSLWDLRLVHLGQPANEPSGLFRPWKQQCITCNLDIPHLPFKSLPFLRSGFSEGTSKLGICQTLPGLRCDFCTLWNESSKKRGKRVGVSCQRLRKIRYHYVSLHQGTDAAPTTFSASTPSLTDFKFPFLFYFLFRFLPPFFCAHFYIRCAISPAFSSYCIFPCGFHSHPT